MQSVYTSLKLFWIPCSGWLLLSVYLLKFFLAGGYKFRTGQNRLVRMPVIPAFLSLHRLHPAQCTIESIFDKNFCFFKRRYPAGFKSHFAIGLCRSIAVQCRSWPPFKLFPVQPPAFQPFNFLFVQFVISYFINGCFYSFTGTPMVGPFMCCSPDDVSSFLPAWFFQWCNNFALSAVGRKVVITCDDSTWFNAIIYKLIVLLQYQYKLARRRRQLF